jgi:hypothetical protein
MGGCPDPDLGVIISIGDYEYHLECWNNMNRLDYTLSLKYTNTIDHRLSKRAVITVRNGIPESSDPPEWLTSGEKSTVLDFFSFIKEEEEKLLKNGGGKSAQNGFFNVFYDYWMHYPHTISYAYRTNASNGTPNWWWDITLMPLEENEQEMGSNEERGMVKN